ncbi:HET domain-containing protein [Microdochium nivale]|nr:HET domain-containing protein [Microdochium nivale]
MYLINAETRRLEYHIGSSIPPYSILSHRWRDEEVDHQTFQTPDKGAHLQGFAKIAAACEQSIKQSIKYTWVDTCCIDKTSSAELTESINSMFEWYEKAEVCFAFLDDVGPDPLELSNASIESSEWMKRGWTLQELLAPKRVEFYALDWTEIGTRDALASTLSRATAISQTYLRDTPLEDSRQTLLLRASMGERMSWAARRQTTRKEDEAYCLLGLFGVNIPLIYGEGGKAFIRLQEEILRHSFDPTLLAWGTLGAGGDPLVPLEAPDPTRLVSALKFIFGRQHPWSRSWHKDDRGFVAPSVGMLAPNARHFLHCGSLVASQSCSGLNWALTPQGLQINLPVSRWLEFKHQPYLVIPCFLRKRPVLLLAVPIIATGNGSFRRGTGEAILVSAHKWYQWSRMDLVLTTGSDAVRIDERFRSSSLCCDVWVRSLPTGFAVAGLPDVGVTGGDGDDVDSGTVLGAEQAWHVSRDAQPDISGDVVWRANLKLLIQSPDEPTLIVHVSRGPYHARPLPAYVPQYALRFRPVSWRNYSAASITAFNGWLPPVEIHERLGEIHRPSQDILEATNGGLDVSVELTEKDIAGRPLLIIDVRHGPSRLSHLWRRCRTRTRSSQTGNVQPASVITCRSVAWMTMASMLRTATWLYDIFRLLYFVILVPSTRLSRARQNSLFLNIVCDVSFWHEAARWFGIRPSSVSSVLPYALACYSFWQLVETDEFLQGHFIIWGRAAIEEGSRHGLSTVTIFFLFHCLLPLVSILVPCITSFLKRHQLILSAAGAGLMYHWRSELDKSPLTMTGCIVFVIKSAAVEGRSPRMI